MAVVIEEHHPHIIHIPLPDYWVVQSASESSTNIPTYDVVLHVIRASNASLGNRTSGSTNASRNDVTLPAKRNESLAQIEIAVLATIFTMAVVGNVCVLVALGRRRKITSRMHMFILHLSIADLLVAFCNILPQLAWDITGTFWGGDVLCRLVTFLQVFVMYLSTYVLVMTAVDRYRAICYPLSNYSWTPRTVSLLIVGVYVLSAVLSVPQPLLFKYQVANDNGDYDCWANFDPPWLLKVYILSFTFLVYLVPFVILVFTYGSICYTIWANQPVSRQQGEESVTTNGKAGTTYSASVLNGGSGYVTSTPMSTSSPSPRRWTTTMHHTNGTAGCKNGVVRPRAHSMRGFSRAKLKTVKLTFVVIMAYLFCWSPFFISHIWWLFDPAQEANSAVVIMVLLSSLNSCCNPWIYLAFSGNLLRHLFPCLLSCCRRPVTRHPAFMLNTPSNSPQRGLEMLVFRGRKKGDLNDAGLASGSMATREKGVYGFDTGLNRSPLRQGSLTSLLTMRLSRNTTSGIPQLSPQRSGLSPVAVTQTPFGDTLLLLERNGQVPDRNNGVSAATNGVVNRKSKVPLDLILQAQADESATASQITKESSSSSNPRSPHLYKRARLHERPAEEVAEAQLKWDQHTGVRGSSSS